jgi:RNA polymerase sigma factor (sigma-70 family)
MGDPNQNDISSLGGSEEADRVFEVALSLVPAAAAVARRYQLGPDTAHEVMMEAAKRVVESRASSHSEPKEQIRNLPAYLFSVGRNLMLAELRRKKDEVQLDDNSNVAVNDIKSIESQILLSEIVRRMNPKARTIFRYRTLGYDYDEIAREFKKMGYRATQASLRSELSKATKRIIRDLEDSGITNL